MNWIQENKKLAGVLGAMVAGVIGLGVWLFLAYSGYSDSYERFKDLTGKVATLEASPLYPSAENVKAKQDKLDAFQDEVEKMRGVLLQLQQPLKAISETEFQSKLKERARYVKQKAGDSAVLLPSADFALGFEEYAKTLPKSPDVAAELNVHLDAMESIVNTFIGAGIKSIDIFDRAKLPTEAGAPPPKITAQVKTVKPKAKGGKRPAVDPVKAAEPVLDRYTVKVTFTTDQLPLQKVVNTFSDFNPKVNPYFTVIRLMRIENEKSEGPLKNDIKIDRNLNPPPAAFQPQKDKKDGDKAIPTVAPAPPDAATVMGEEMLKVFMEIDYIRFREADAGTAEQATGK